MTTSRIYICIFILYIIGFFAHALYLHKTIYGDGRFYYAWLRSIAIDHDIHFANEYKAFGASQPMTSFKIYGNKYSIGPALFWAPAFLTTHSIMHGDGYTLPYQLAVGLTDALLTLFSFMLLYRLLQGSQQSKQYTILTLACATNIFFYGSLDTVNSHSISFFAATLFLSLLSMKKPNWFAIGASLSLLGMVRLQDFIFIILILPYWKTIKPVPFFAGCIIAFLPQLFAWLTLYGTIWTNPYIAGGETFSLFTPHILGVLFHKDSGLFLWTPVVTLGVIGLWIKRSTRWPYLLVFLVELWLVASWSTWWQGASFSGRMFTSSLPLIAFGLSPLIEKLITLVGKQITLLFISTFSLLTMLSIIYFLLTH